MLAAVVAVEHGGHGVHPQAVHAKALQPVQRIADQVVAHLRAAQVADQRVPVGVEAFARVGVFVQVGAVEVGQAVGVGGKVRRHPVEQHAQTRSMCGLHKPLEAGAVAHACAVGGRCAEAGRGRVQPHRLVAPAAVERVLADGQQLDVGEAQASGMGHQLGGQLVPGQPAVAVGGRRAAPGLPVPLGGRTGRSPVLGAMVGFAPPGARMHLVDADRCAQRVGGSTLGAGWHLGGHRGHHAGGGRAQFGRTCNRVGLLRQQLALRAQQLEFVACALGQARNEQLPHTAFTAQAHRVTAAVPAVEIAHHADPGCIGRPHGKAGARHTVVHAGDGAQHLERAQVRAFGQQPGIEFAQQRAETVGVVLQLHTAIRPGDLQAVGRTVGGQRGLAVPHTIGMQRLQLAQAAAVGHADHGHRAGIWQKGPHRHATRGVAVWAQHRKRVAVAAVAQAVNLVGAEHGGLSPVLLVRLPLPRAGQACASTCQIWAAYSRMVRSAENGPMPATLAIALRDQASGSL